MHRCNSEKVISMIIKVENQDGFFDGFPVIQRILEINRGLENPCRIEEVYYYNGFGERTITVTTLKNGSKPKGYDENFLELVFQCFEKDDVLSQYQVEEYDKIDEFSMRFDEFKVFL